MKYKDEIEVMFWNGMNRDGAAATHNAYEDCIRQIGYITDVTQYLAEQE